MAKDPEAEPAWMTEPEIFELYKKSIPFIDVTDHWNTLGDGVTAFASGKLQPSYIPTKPAQEELVRSLNSKIDPAAMKSFLTAFSGFQTRYFRSNAGTLSQAWLTEQVKIYAEKASDKVNVTVREFAHTWNQASIIVRLEKAGVADEEAKKGEIVIVSAHQDSVNQWNPYFGRSPGADDDGSGTTTIFEAYRILIDEGFVPVKPIEFHFYSAEEGGLLGSQDVVANYKKAGVPVVGVYHADMTGYPAKKPSIGLSTDFVDPSLMAFLKVLVETYCDEPTVFTKCGYACSDHATWTKAGYRSSFTFEGAFDDHSPYIHTTGDSVETLSFTHMAQFVRVAISFAVELSSA
ncbi:hypothetical protein SmJEL517_g04976 [Synchytrium microbalum]|uniref:Peptide hydrolase n=1 Tax=Synchytrium microbalum TaxID=1806994 RepID=A0A507C1A5_9FUNG|nr:uncharacterized protein SmJEL517_g04976 [Synchytrium microbalum]TPX31766.1 hypothetical protein SmJEL517_g04976 [Synchytrium microbalum]